MPFFDNGLLLFFFFNDTATTEIYTLSLHDALPIYYVTVPRDMLDAGRIDGAGFFGLYWWIMLPIAAPAFAVALIWQFTNIWNDFLLGVVVLSNPSLAPMTVAINNIAGSFSIEWNLQMAAAVLAAAPTVLVYLFLGRLFMRGLLAGA